MHYAGFDYQELATVPVPADSAQRLSLALSASRMGDWSWDSATDVVTLSDRAAEIFGIPPGPHMTWDAMREVLHPDDRERAREAVVQALERRDDYDIEYRVRHEGGADRWISARGRGFYDQAGAVQGMLGVVHDITERKTLEAQLERRGQSLEIVNQVGLIVAAELDLHKIVSAVTDAATKVSGARFGAFFYNLLDEKGESYTLYTLSGVDRSHFEKFPMPRNTAVFGPTFRGEGTIRLANVKKDARYGKNDTYHGMPPGHLPVTSYLAVPVVSRNGEVHGGLFLGHEEEGVFDEAAQAVVEGLAAQAAVAIDNARLYELEQRSRRAAEDANQMKDEFLATLSHELRTPLTSIVGWVHMLRTGRLAEADQRRALETIERNAKAQQQIIEDILDVSRIMTGKLRLELTPVNVVEAVEAAIEALRPLMEAKEQRLVRVMESPGITVLGDRNRLQQVFWNLVSNAIKFTPKGGRINVSLKRADSRVEILVSDSGEGIAPEFLPHVFDRFKQADSSTTRPHGGIGLGLSIVRHLLELHGGTVHAASAGPGKGSTFTVCLPVAVAVARDEPRRMNMARERTREPSDVPGADAYDIKGLKVLVLDDEADARELIAAILARSGAEVEAASSVAEALRCVPRWKPHVIVSDIGMPGEDGYSFMNKLRRLPHAEGGSIPAAALTAYARAEDRLRSLSAGFQTHVAKPVDPVELVAVVASLGGRTGRAAPR